MGIETSYYVVDWDWLTRGVAAEGGLDFFHDLLDDDPEEGKPGDAMTDWRSVVELPPSPLWENWRAAQSLAVELQSPLAQKMISDHELVTSFLKALAAIPDHANGQFLPEGALGPPGDLDEEYMGALSPSQVSAYLNQGDDLRHSVRQLRVIHEGVSTVSHLSRLPEIVEAYLALLEAAQRRGWGILITAS